MEIVLMVSGIQKSKKESLALTTLNFAYRLTDQGHNVTVISRNKWNEPAHEVVDGITFLRTSNIWKISLYNKLLAFPFAIKKLRKKKEIDIMHSFSAAPILVLRSLMARKLFARKARVIHTLKSYPIKKDVRKKKGSLLLSRLGDSYKFLNYADFVTVPTEVHAKKLVANGVRHGKIKVVHSCIDLRKFFPQDREKMKVKYGYENKKVIFYYGSMWEIKGTDYLIKSLPLIIKKIPNVKVIFAPRNQNPALEKYLPLIEKMKMEKHIDFVLKDVKIEDYVNLADAVVLPYPHLEGTEGNPSCLLEALACGTPVVSTDLPELREVFSECAILTKPKDVHVLAGAIVSVLRGDNSAKIKKGLEKVKEFSIDKITLEFLSLYNK